MNTTETVAPATETAETTAAPATMSQQSLWFIDQLLPGGAVYNMSRMFQVKGVLDTAALAEALSRVVARHEALRTTFTEAGGRVYQVINPPVPVSPKLVDLSEVPEDDRLATALDVAAAESDRPFDLAAGPLLRCCLVTLGAADHLLTIVIHHIVCDGASLDLLARDLGDCYADVRLDRPAAAPPALQFGDIAAWEADWFADPAFAKQLAHWRDRLDGAPRNLALPTDRPRPDPPTYGGARVALRVPETATRALRQLAQAEQATPFMVSLGAFMLLLGRHTGSTDVVVGAPVAGRHRHEFADVIGFFVNTLAIRGDLRGEPTFRELVRRVRDECLDAFAHQAVPFAKLVEDLNPDRDLTRNPLVQVLFQLVSGRDDGPELAGTTVSAVPAANRFTEVDMEVQLIEAGGGLDVSWIYSTDLYDEPTIERLGRAFVALLEEAVGEPDRPIADFSALGPDEAAGFACAGVRVVDTNLQRSPIGVPGQLCVTGAPVAAAALGSPAQTARHLLPDPFAGEPGTRMFATGDRAVVRPDGVVELLVPEQAAEPAGAPTGFVAPRTPREHDLAAIWAELLEVDQVGRHDDFFDLGGHSILAIRATIMLRERFDCDLPLRTIFDAPTVAAMDEMITAAEAG